MAHYAQLDENNIVVNIFVGRDEYDLEDNISNWEDHYVEFMPEGHKVRRTSYNTFGGKHYTDGILSEDQSKSFRKNYAEIGFYFDEERDAFIPPQPFPSWSLDENSCLWIAPKTMPEDGMVYLWSEEEQNWVLAPDA